MRVCVPSRTTEYGVDGEALLLETPGGLTGKIVSFADNPVNFTEGQRKVPQLPTLFNFFFHY